MQHLNWSACGVRVFLGVAYKFAIPVFKRERLTCPNKALPCMASAHAVFARNWTPLAVRQCGLSPGPGPPKAQEEEVGPARVLGGGSAGASELSPRWSKIRYPTDRFDHGWCGRISMYEKCWRPVYCTMSMHVSKHQQAKLILSRRATASLSPWKCNR